MDKLLAAAKSLSPSQVVTFVLFLVLAAFLRESELSRTQYAADRSEWARQMDRRDHDAREQVDAVRSIASDVRTLTSEVGRTQGLILDHLLQVKREQRDIKSQLRAAMPTETAPMPKDVSYPQ